MTVTKFPSTPTPIAAALHAAFVGVAFASGARGVAQSAHAGAGPGEESTKRSFRIRAGPLGPALSRFATRAGARLSFDPALTEGKTTRGLSGDFTREEGPAALLAGTGLEWAPGPGGTYTVRPTALAQATPEAPVHTGEQPVELDPIIVTAQPLNQGFKANMQETATKTPLSIRETPQSISVIAQDSLKARQVIGLGQALETVAGVTQSHEPGPFGGRSPIGFSQQKIRGIQGEFFFDVREDGFLNPHIFASTDLAPYERVEVIKGPSSTLYGRGVAGGFVNQVRKKPLPEFQTEIATSIGSYDLYRLDADVTGPLAGTDWARGRLVAAYESAGAYVDFVDSERVVVAPSLELDVTDSTRLLLQGTYQSDHGLANPGFPLLPDGENFKAPDVRRSLLFGLSHVDEDDNPRELISGSLQLDHKLGDAWLATLRLSTSSSKSDTEYAQVFGLYPNGDALLYSNASDFDADAWSGEIRLNGSFEAFGHSASLTLGAEHSDFEVFGPNAFELLGTVNIYDGNFGDIAFERPPIDRLTAADFRSTGAYAQMHWRATDRLGVLLGGRYDRVDTTAGFLSEFDAAGVLGQREDDRFTGRAGLTFDLFEHITVYGLYAQSFTPNTFASVDRNGTVLDPVDGEIFEAGLKTEWFDGRLGANAALFRIERDKVPIRDPDNAPGEFFSIASGLQRADGFELEINGEPLPGWNLSFAGILLDSEFIDRRDRNFGNSPRDVADWQIGLYTSYELQSGPLKGLGFGTGLFAIDDRSVTESSSGKLEGYERVDLQVFYNGFEPLNISLQVRNVFDKKYVETQTFSSFGNTFGSPTAVLLTVRYDFDY